MTSSYTVTYAPRARAAVLPDEVQNREHSLARRAPQPASELLQEHCRARRRPEQQQSVHIGQIDALIEQVDGEQTLDVAVAQRDSGLCPLGERGLSDIGL